MAKTTSSWSLGGEPPEAADMPAPDADETAAIQEEVQKVKDAERKKIDDAVERGRSKARKGKGKDEHQAARIEGPAAPGSAARAGTSTTVDPGAA